MRMRTSKIKREDSLIFARSRSRSLYFIYIYIHANAKVEEFNGLLMRQKGNLQEICNRLKQLAVYYSSEYSSEKIYLMKIRLKCLSKVSHTEYLENLWPNEIGFKQTHIHRTKSTNKIHIHAVI